MSLETDDTTKRFIILSFCFMGFFASVAIYAFFIGMPQQEQEYQTLKPILNQEPCAELEKIISYSNDNTAVFFAKRNYNERCL